MLLMRSAALLALRSGVVLRLGALLRFTLRALLRLTLRTRLSLLLKLRVLLLRLLLELLMLLRLLLLELLMLLLLRLLLKLLLMLLLLLNRAVVLIVLCRMILLRIAIGAIGALCLRMHRRRSRMVFRIQRTRREEGLRTPAIARRIGIAIIVGAHLMLLLEAGGLDVALLHRLPLHRQRLMLHAAGTAIE